MGPSSVPPDREKVFRVSELNRAVRVLVEDRWPNIWVQGELSDVARAASGHLYFTLNDEDEPAQVRGVMFRSDVRRAKAQLEDGARVRMRGSLSLFEPRGTYQLIARIALPAGRGDLYLQFQRVRAKLEAEGLFALERKRALPSLPQVVGVVTSASGAALQDVIRVASTRCPVRIVVSPCLVQGAEAPESIVSALQAIQRVDGLDLVIVGRGGGSADDLYAFNDERVARSIAACIVPTVSAVGHEVDVTIADMVADVRAATPSNAAEIAVPEQEVLASQLHAFQRALERAMEVVLARHRLQLDRVAQRLADPREALGRTRNRLQWLRAQIGRIAQQRLARERARVQALGLCVSRRDPRVLMSQDRAALAQLSSRLHALAGPLLDKPRASLAELSSEARAFMQLRVAEHRTRLTTLCTHLEALSPLGVLARGYAIALHAKTGKALLHASDAQPGDRVTLRLHQGQLRTKVEE